MAILGCGNSPLPDYIFGQISFLRNWFFFFWETVYANKTWLMQIPFFFLNILLRSVQCQEHSWYAMGKREICPFRMHNELTTTKRITSSMAKCCAHLLAIFFFVRRTLTTNNTHCMCMYEVIRSLMTSEQQMSIWTKNSIDYHVVTNIILRYWKKWTYQIYEDAVNIKRNNKNPQI